MQQDYKDLIKDVGKKEFDSRFRELLRQITEFLEEAGYQEHVECNERILYHVLLDYYSDIRRLKDFHKIIHTKTDKVMAYLIYWIVRRKPIQFTGFTEMEKDIFVNERFACYLLFAESVMGNVNKQLNADECAAYKNYVESLLYYFKYRQINPQVIELLIETFKIGRLFPIGVN